MIQIIKRLLFLFFISLSACADTDPYEKKCEEYFERVEPILDGSVYPSTFEIIENGNLIGYQLSIVGNLNFEDTVYCRIRVFDNQDNLIPYQLFGEDLDEFGNRKFIFYKGMGRFTNIFVEHPKNVERIELESNKFDDLILYQTGDSVGTAMSWIFPQEIKYEL